MAQASGAARPYLPDCLSAAGVVGAWTQDTATGLVVADLPVAHLFGLWHPDAANGDPLERYADAIHPADRAGFAIGIAASARHGTPVALQYRVRTSGGVRFVHDYGCFTLDGASRPLRGQGIVIDATRMRGEAEAVAEIAAQGVLDDRTRTRVNALAKHVIAASEIARTLPSSRLRALTDPLLWEVGRLLAWAMAKRKP